MLTSTIALLFALLASSQATSLCGYLPSIVPATSSYNIKLATSITPGSNFTGNTSEPGYNGLQSNLPASCRVIFAVATSGNGTANAEVWLPANWTGRYMTVGNGGFAGGVNYPDIFWSLRKGFAVMSTDTGHQSTQGDGSWLSDAGAATDWGHRALHLSTLAAKDIVESYYGIAAAHSYYAGCSTGGRQGLNAAQRYPEDFDGVLVSSAIPWQTHTAAWQTYVASKVCQAKNVSGKTFTGWLLTLQQQYPQNASNAAYIPASLWPIIAAAVMQQCDEIDGLKDDIIMNPARCNFQPEVLFCRHAGTSHGGCMNGAQVANLKRMYRPWLTASGELINPGISHSGEASFSFLMNQPEPQFGPTFYGYAVVNDSQWDWRTISPDTVALADNINPGGANAYNASAMMAFHDRGGKVIQYHGYSDPLIPVYNAEAWYDKLVAIFSEAGRGGKVADFYRLFAVPGMGHCSGGAGAWAVDGAGQGSITSPSNDAGHSMLWSLVDWVEGKASAPDSVIGTKYVDDKIAFQRPVCRWPSVAEYVGGNTSMADSWTCPSTGVF
jgi:feruloyl esterase